MSMKAGFLLLAIGVIQVSSEYVEPKFIEDAIEEQSKLQGPSRIVSGWEAELGQHPHQANLRQVNAVGSINTCGGSFVHYEWLITAAHCTAQRVTIVVRGGLVSLTRPEYFFETTLYWNHPSYNNDLVTTVQQNDISLVKLQRPATFTKNLQPIRIQRSKDAFNNYENLVLYASGHGRTWTDGTSPEVLRWVYLRGVSNAYCSSIFVSGLINDNSICARYYNVTSQSTCQGDSGGPLVHVNAQGDKFLVGVASFVAGAPVGCHSGYPAGFIRPGPFHSWFKEVTGINFDEEEGQTTTNLPPSESEETTESNETEESNETIESNETEESNETKESNETGESNETKESNETEESIEDSDETEESKEDSNEDDSDSSDDSDSDSSDDDSDEGTRRHPKLQVKVKVKVNVKNYKGERHSIKEVIKK